MMTEKTSLLTFPCEFPIKVLGISDSDLLPEVIRIIEANCSDFKAHKDITVKPSTKGNYSAITITITAKSQHQLDTIYLALNQHKLVKITL